MSPSKTTVKGEAGIDLPLERAWELLRDLERAKHYVPGVTDVELTSERTEGLGASRRVITDRGPMDETVVRWNEGRGFVIRLHRDDEGPPPPFAEASFEYALEPAGDACRIRTALSYTPRWGLPGRVLDALVLRRATQRMARQVAEGLARHYEQAAVEATSAPGPSRSRGRGPGRSA